MKLSRIGIDLAKNVFQLHGVDRHGKTVWKRRLKRNQWSGSHCRQSGNVRFGSFSACHNSIT